MIQTPDGEPYARLRRLHELRQPGRAPVPDRDRASRPRKAGVDDILYDYVRRPDGPLSTMVFPGLHGHAGAVDRRASSRETRGALEPYGTFLGASVFGVAATRPTEVAQDIPAMARERRLRRADGLPVALGAAASTASPTRTREPYDDRAALARGLPARRSRGTGARVVPWLQDFSLGVDYGPGPGRGGDPGGARRRDRRVPALGSLRHVHGRRAEHRCEAAATFAKPEPCSRRDREAGRARRRPGAHAPPAPPARQRVRHDALAVPASS